ncbi:MAG TPA: penicillin acylase family protein [Candidatus Limnocylindria bacterium]
MPSRPGTRSLLRLLGRRLPRAHGAIKVAGIGAPVVIGRDRWGIPHIEAESDVDAWFALGFCHGQDRRFQLELLARAGRGTLAELLGPPAIGIDRLSRTLGFRRVAVAQRALLDADIVATLEAYVAGVNAANASSPRPHELVLLRARPTAWEVEDVLAFMGLQSLVLAGNWDMELARLAILMTDGPDALAAVDAGYAAWLPVVDPPGHAAGAALDRLALDLGALRDLVGGSGGSNAWAVAGSRTTTGSPILANDPHLAAGVPAPWYLVHLRTPEWQVAGASFVGGPVVPSGHNGHIAWGITAGCTDSADLFWEEIRDDTARGPHGDEPITRLREEILVRRGDPVIEEVILTARGPVLTPVLDGIGAALSLRATWLEPAPVRGLLDVIGARDFASFRSGFDAWPGPALNVVYADAGGHVGWQLIGTLPRRRAGNGTLPAPAWEAGWEPDHLPFEALPFQLDPPEGFIVSANNAPRPVSPDAPMLGSDWLDGYRAAAINERLGERDDWSVASTAVLQVDVTSVPWRDLRDVVLAVEPVDDAEKLALALLRTWDGQASATSPAASVFELLVAELATITTRRAAPEGWQWAMGAGFGEIISRTAFGARTVSRLVAQLRDQPDNQDDIRSALRVAIAALTERRGADPARWAWGDVRPVRLLHPLGGLRPLDRALNLGPIAVGGDTNTVAQSGVHPLDPLGPVGAIANHRMVINLGDVEMSRFVVAGGQSGNPLSPHYDDLLDLWVRGDGVPIPWNRDLVEAAVVDRLVLRPPD